MLTNIYTTYFAALKKLPSDIIPISIAVSAPPKYSGLVYNRLYPPKDILLKYKRDKDEASYVREYTARILNNANPYEVLTELDKLASYWMENILRGDASKGVKIALVCYEKPEDFCHRHLVARWLKNINIPVEEYRV